MEEKKNYSSTEIKIISPTPLKPQSILQKNDQNQITLDNINSVIISDFTKKNSAFKYFKFFCYIYRTPISKSAKCSLSKDEVILNDWPLEKSLLD